MTRRQERRQEPVDISSTPVAALDGTQADGQQASQVALSGAVRPDDKRDPFTEAQPELVERQHAHARQRRYPHPTSLGTQRSAVASVPVVTRRQQLVSPVVVWGGRCLKQS